VTLLIAALGTDRARAYATACPLPVEADMRHLDRAPLLTHQRDWLCTAAMVLLSGLNPIKVLV
jgi:hypothetical protein